MESTEVTTNHRAIGTPGYVPPPPRFRYIGEMLLAVGCALLVMIVMTAIVSFTWLITTSLYHRFTSP